MPITGSTGWSAATGGSWIWGATFGGKRFFLRFDGTARLATVYVNGRATSGARFIKQSYRYEDVYACNDFSHTGNTLSQLR